MKLFARRALAFLAWSPLLLTTAGCDNQSEGERCDQHHGNLDCDEGLTCKQVYVFGYHYICCPEPPAPVNVAACNAAGKPPTDGGATTVDAGPDARAESGTDTSVPDVNGNDASDEATDDRSSIDTRGDRLPDMSVDMAVPDVSADATTADAQDAPDDRPSTDQTSADRTDDTTPVDSPAPDTAPDAPPDVASDASQDGPELDIMTPIDVADAPAEGEAG
jgi:hypothetical protein